MPDELPPREALPQGVTLGGSRPPERQPNFALRVIVFALVGVMTLLISGRLLYSWAGQLITGAAASFLAASLANWLTLRIYERGRIGDLGLEWNRATGRNLLIGFAGGAGAALLVSLIPLLVGWARLEEQPEQPRNLVSLLFVSTVLWFGAVGEEMLFRGYAYQLLLKRWGPFSATLPMGVMFAWAHSGNPGIEPLGHVNTFLWGVLFGFCFLRAGNLWLPIGVHFGWNWVLPLFGVNLSGFTMSVSGYSMTWDAPAIWSGGAYGLEGSLLTSLVLPLVGWYLFKAPVAVERPALLAGSEEEEWPSAF